MLNMVRLLSSFDIEYELNRDKSPSVKDWRNEEVLDWNADYIFIKPHLTVFFRRSFCLVSDQHLFVSDSDANLQPLFYFTEEPSGIVYGRRGNSVCLNCTAFCAESGAVTITWRKDDRTITNTSRRYVLGNGTLCIERLRRPADEGFYECLAAHRLGTIVSPKVKVELTSEFLYYLGYDWV